MGENSRKTAKVVGKPFKAGETGNPNGRPKGRKNFKTLFYEAIERIAAEKGESPDEFEIKLVEQAIRKGFNGDRGFYSDTMDRVHGKAPQPLSNADGQPLIIAFDESFKK